MKSKPLLLTLLLAIGFSFPNCHRGDDGFDCNCSPFEGDYFDVKGILEIVNYKERGTCCADALKENDTVRFSDYDFLSIKFDVDYHSSNLLRRRTWDFSLMNEALACSCLTSGWLGSKEEQLDSISIITLNDFDAEHLANRSINDLMQTYMDEKRVNVNEFSAQNMSPLQYE